MLKFVLKSFDNKQTQRAKLKSNVNFGDQKNDNHGIGAYCIQ